MPCLANQAIEIKQIIFWWNIKYEMTNEQTSNRLDLGINILYNLSWKCKILYHEEGLLLIL